MGLTTGPHARSHDLTEGGIVENDDYDEYEQNLAEYEDQVRDTLDHADDQTNLLFKNILKKEGFGGFGKGRNSEKQRNT